MRILLSILGCLVASGASQAAVGTVDMTWDGCTGPVDKTTTTPDFYSIFITVIGHDQATRAYDVRVYYGNATQEVPDAWRFDADGCETSAGIQQDATSKECPAFGESADSNFVIKFVRFSQPYKTLMEVIFAHSYAPGNAPNPATRYLLERIRFDLNAAVPGEGSATTCGGFEQPMCFALNFATFLDVNRNEIPFNYSRPSLTVAFNGLAANCPGSSPARASTWGSIKGQYLN
jgi:hypothetical protein